MNHYIKKIYTALSILKNYGPSGVAQKIALKRLYKNEGKRIKAFWEQRNGFEISPSAFGVPLDLYEQQKKIVFDENIKFSILVPLYNTPETFLKEMIASVLLQSYQNWELCLADGSDENHSYIGKICKELSQKDSRIKYKNLSENKGISANTNECVDMATGDYISLFDHDDLLHPCALFETAKAIHEKNAEFIYTDEATFKSPNLYEILNTNFKPDYAPEYFHGCNYICHFSSFKKSLLNQMVDFNPECDGAQDYDIFLRLLEKTDKIHHIKKCLYYWRASPSSTAGGASAKNYTTIAGQKALQNHFDRIGIDAKVENGRIPNTYSVKYAIKRTPLISILITNFTNLKRLANCINSVKKSTYKNLEVIILDDHNAIKSSKSIYGKLINDKNISIISFNGQTTYPQILNIGAEKSNGEYIITLDSSTEIFTPTWIEDMLMFAQLEKSGAIGAIICNDKNKIVFGGGIVEHDHLQISHHGTNINQCGYAHRLFTNQNYSWCISFCMMFSKNLFLKVNGFDKSLPFPLCDVDFCLKLLKLGYRNIWTPKPNIISNKTKNLSTKAMNELIKKSNYKVSEEDMFFNKNLTPNVENGFVFRTCSIFACK